MKKNRYRDLDEEMADAIMTAIKLTAYLCMVGFVAWLMYQIDR